MTVRIRIVVLEDNVEVDEANIAYYDGQPYRVELATPDGTDLRLPMDGYREAGREDGTA